jgi:hypothetical protein
VKIVSLTKDDVNAIKQVFSNEAKKVVDAVIKADEQKKIEERNYFQETEKLLYSYPALKEKIESDEEFLFDPLSIIYPECKSKDIVRYSSNSGTSTAFDVEQYTDSIKKSMLRTRAEVTRIDRALSHVKDDKYFRIIELKYFEKKENQEQYTFEDIAEILDKDESTIRRNKNRLINALVIYLFGADPLTKLT